MSTEQTTVRVAEAIEIVKGEKVTGTFLVGDKVTVGLKDLTQETGVKVVSGRVDSIHRLDARVRVDTSAEFNASVEDVKLADVVDMVAYGTTLDVGVKQEETPVPTSTPVVTATTDEVAPVVEPVVTPVVTEAAPVVETQVAEPVAEKAVETPVVEAAVEETVVATTPAVEPEVTPVVTPVAVEAPATDTAFQADVQTATVPEGITEVK